MSKSRITFRFDRTGERIPHKPKREQPVIPLEKEEFHVVEDEIPLESSWNPGEKRQEDSHRQPGMETVEHLFTPHQLNEFTTDFGVYTSPFDGETKRVEQIIRDSQKKERNPYEEEKVPLEPAYLSYEHRIDDGFVPLTGTSIVRKKRGSLPWMKVGASVMGAILTGAAFGFFVLSMFSSSEGDAKQKVTPPPAAVQANTKPKSEGKAEPASASAGTGQAAAVNIPAKSFSFLQGGVFSNTQGARAAEEKLKKEGFAPVLDSGEKVTVFVGFALEKEDAVKISQLVKEKNEDIYVKNLDIPAISKVKWKNNKPDQLAGLLAQGDKNLQAMNNLTILHLKEAAPAALDQATMKTLQSEAEKWKNLYTAATVGIPAEGKGALEKLNASLQTAVQTFEEYTKKPDRERLWAAQSELMKYVLAERELASVLSAE